jgi:hypothetical protein
MNDKDRIHTYTPHTHTLETSSQHMLDGSLSFLFSLIGYLIIIYIIDLYLISNFLFYISFLAFLGSTTAIIFYSISNMDS